MVREREREREQRTVIWALYDDAKSSYKNAITKFFCNKYQIHSIGINDVYFKKSLNYFYHKIDLSLNNYNLINQLKKLPKPAIILASPPCESWSGADCAGKMFKSIDDDGNWKVMNKKYYDKYNQKCHPVKRRYFFQKEQGRILGESTIGATIQIIEYFKPKIWIIENPQTSKTWDFQLHHHNFAGFMNLAFYSSYDNNFSRKPTIFKSNIKLNFKKTKKFGNKTHMANGNYSQRSAIPHSLIKFIIEQIEEQLC